MAKAKVHRGQELRLGPLRILVGIVQDETAEVHVMFGTEGALGHSLATPVSTLENLVDWHAKLPIGQIEECRC